MSVRFAFKTANQNTTWSDVLAVWKEGDGIERFESGWNFDHFYPIVGDTAGPCLEGWSMLAALAQATTRLRLGCLVTGIHYRHPAVLANMVSTVDIISNGRLELGIGAGWNEEESDGYGIELGDRRERSDRFEEACEVLVRLLSQETSSYQGAYYTLSEARNEPKGPQKPYPPICIGGSGEKRTLLPPPGTPNTGTTAAPTRSSSRTSATYCTPTAMPSAATRRRSCSPPTFASTTTTMSPRPRPTRRPWAKPGPNSRFSTCGHRSHRRSSNRLRRHWSRLPEWAIVRAYGRTAR